MHGDDSVRSEGKRVSNLCMFQQVYLYPVTEVSLIVCFKCNIQKQTPFYCLSMNDDLNVLDDAVQLTPSTECRYYLPNELNLLPLNDNSFSLLHLNARSLSCNFDNVCSLLGSIKHSFSFIGVTESWLKPNSPPLFDIQGYKMLRADRPTGRGGGAVLYVKEGIQYRVINGIPDSPDFQTIFVEVEKSVGKNVVVGVTYRPQTHLLIRLLTTWSHVLT